MAADKLWVEKDGKRELHTAINARDLINNAGWKVCLDQTGATSEDEPVSPPVVDDEVESNDTEAQDDDTEAQDDDTEAQDDDKTTDELGNTVVFTEDSSLSSAPVTSTDETPQPPPPPNVGGTIPPNEPPLDESKAPVDIVEETQRAIATLSKVELEAYARKNFGFEVDRRHSESKIRSQILGLAEAKRVSPTGL